jgi:hypothetical protein
VGRGSATRLIEALGERGGHRGSAKIVALDWSSTLGDVAVRYSAVERTGGPTAVAIFVDAG